MSVATDKSQDPLDRADSAFERRARALLQESIDRLPAHTRSRLTRSRHAALAQGRGWSYSSLVRRWVPAGAGAVAAATLALLLLIRPHGEVAVVGPLVANASPEDFELLADSDAVQLGRDADVDYDFYEWAVSEAKDSGGSSVGT
jgi:hypothetical protein